MPTFGAFAEKQEYVALGDSITSGYGLVESSDSFTEIVANSLDMELKNLAVDGQTSGGLLKVVSSNENKKAIKNADLITISIGGNDLLQVLFKLIRDVAGLSEDVKFTELQEALLNVDNLIPQIKEILDKPENLALFDKAIEDYSKNIDQILETIRKLNPDAKIVLLNLYNPLSGSPVFRNISSSAQTIVDKINIVTAMKKGENIEVADIGKAFFNRGMLLTNILYLDIHTNKAGNTVIAKTLMMVIER